MDQWHTSTKPPYQSAGGHLVRVLTNSSGNAQTYALDSTEGIENQNPFAPGRFSSKHETKPGQQFPIPKIKLGSNDHYSDNLLRLQARRHHRQEKAFRQRRPNHERPYLQHPKYLQYRARQRCDTGPDGKPVWDDRIEDAFQNALTNIEPMGRRKKSQRGRPHGRNELISEWIKQETGEHRSRKQVSSHIQVLNTLLKGIPEWDALITASEAIGSDRPGHEYYSDSIERMVRSQNPETTNPQSYQSTRGNFSGGFVDQHLLTRLSFEMWVSLPNQMDQALHIYSRLQSSNATSVPMPLEHVKNWRGSFPSLRPIIYGWNTHESCDIILLEASFHLMSEFPPKFSKLGISLELDFLHSSNNNRGALAALENWASSTHMYQHGRLVKEVTHDDCHVSGIGKVKPFFESKWWASTFTQLTEKRKMAEDSKNDGALELANEYSRNFFRGLTVMQEISAGAPNSHNSTGIWSDQIPARRPMAILLWKFSQAPNPYVGTTTWHKVIPPLEPLSATARTPTSLSAVPLPPLTIDSTADGAHGENLFGTPLTAREHQYSMFGQHTEDSLYQDSILNYKPRSMTSFEDAAFELQPSHMTLDHDMNIGFDMATNDMTDFGAASLATSANFFELPQLRHEVLDRKESIHTVSQSDSFNEPEHSSSHQPLVKFDMNTHQMLQAQLGTDDDDPFYTQPPQPVSTESQYPPQDLTTSHSQHRRIAHLDEDDEALRAALLAASPMHNLSDAQTSFSNNNQAPTIQPSQDPLYIPSSQPFTSPSTLTVRPHLQTHHSFGGTTSMSTNDPIFPNHHPTHSRKSSKNDFARLLANLPMYNANHEVDLSLDFTGSETDHQHNHTTTNLGIGTGINRPQSQPVLMSGAVDVLYQEMMGHAHQSQSGDLGSADEHVWLDVVPSAADVGADEDDRTERAEGDLGSNADGSGAGAEGGGGGGYVMITVEEATCE